jgi:hypothetical protein
MAAAGGAASIITQVQQTTGPPINTLGGKFGTALALKERDSLTLCSAGEAAADEHITLDLRLVTQDEASKQTSS